MYREAFGEDIYPIRGYSRTKCEHSTKTSGGALAQKYATGKRFLIIFALASRKIFLTNITESSGNLDVYGQSLG